MTGYFAKGRGRRYAYYKCFQHHCPTRTKSYPASAAHDELLEFLASESIPHYLATSIVQAIVAAYCETTDQNRTVSERFRAEEEQLKAQLHELISMRTARLVYDDEFVPQRQRLRRRLFEIQASRPQVDEELLSPTEVHELVDVLTDLSATWRSTPIEAKRGFSRLVFPAGYVFQRIRTAERGLLFKTLEASGTPSLNVGSPVIFESIDESNR